MLFFMLYFCLRKCLSGSALPAEICCTCGIYCLPQSVTERRINKYGMYMYHRNVTAALSLCSVSLLPAAEMVGGGGGGGGGGGDAILSEESVQTGCPLALPKQHCRISCQLKALQDGLFQRGSPWPLMGDFFLTIFTVLPAFNYRPSHSWR